MRVASNQLAAGDRSKEEQIERARRLIDRVGEADLILLPELWTSGAFAYDRLEADAEPLEGSGTAGPAGSGGGPTLEAMREIARERRCHLFAGSWVECSEEGLHNTAVFLSPEGGVLAAYRKIHLFSYQSREREMLVPGGSPVVVRTPLGAFGLATCYDLRFPEMFRALVDRGAECFLVTSGWPYPRLEHWILLNRVRALESQCWLISCNSCGEQGGVRYVGHSMVVDPWGIPAASAGDRETVLTAEVDLARVSEIRAEFPVLADRVLPTPSDSPEPSRLP
ncbi:MAG: carbon-nitrogen family hydrolase [Nitrospinota bacterium]